MIVKNNIRINTISLSLDKCDINIQGHDFLEVIEWSLNLNNEDIILIGIYGPKKVYIKLVNDFLKKSLLISQKILYNTKISMERFII